MITQTLFQASSQANEQIETLVDVLLNPNSRVLREWSASGQLGKVVPEWQRLTGPRNVQHVTHHFKLDDHTLKVIERIKTSPYYDSLTDYQQFLVTLSGLLHDIEKNTGSERLKGFVPVDKLHPIKSAERSRDILTRMQFPPKTIQRVYTLIHHHQLIGRLFIFYKEGAPHHVLRKIALKVRSQGVLNCLLALSEGDIRGVQKGDAFFTPDVADQLASYGQIVGQEIQQFRHAIPLMPQNLALNVELGWQLSLEQSSCFVLPASSWASLLERLQAIQWGGVSILPYYRKLSQLAADQVSYAALIRFLPENIAYWGPASPLGVDWNNPSEKIDMNLFYSLLQRIALPPVFGSAIQEELMAYCLEKQPQLINMLEGVSQRQGYENWEQSNLAFEEGWFEPSESPLPVDPLLVECQKAYLEFFPEEPCMGIATRPILMGFYTRAKDRPTLPKPWSTVPIFTVR